MKRCIDCSHFCYWDGDWCCSIKLKIISGINEKTINPNNCTKERDCEDYRDCALDLTPIGLKIREEEWKSFL